MDFLLLPTDRSRLVVEVDGRQHYCDEAGAASPQRYAAMVREDRAIRLDGYEVYRFGGAELRAPQGGALADEFFDRLLDRHAPSS
jgi:very-short-patch-repair endonuclease